ncbi:tyrosinase protein tyr-1 [Biomphalaria glabrata]|nr:tyrosinase protein tyr-1 [Biomphalaria glabrata]
MNTSSTVDNSLGSKMMTSLVFISSLLLCVLKPSLTELNTTVELLSFNSTKYVSIQSTTTNTPFELNTTDTPFELNTTDDPFETDATEDPLEVDEDDDSSNNDTSSDEPPYRYSEDQLSYYAHLYEKFMERVPGLLDRQNVTSLPPSKICLRKEYRLLSDQERARFHSAINTLKNDISVRPNKYDAIALIHSGGNLKVAHRGPGFLGWHRLYLMIYETALQEVDPSVCLTYWDTTIESRLYDPSESSLWSHELLGSPEGRVTSGPFANWTTPTGKPLSREIAQDGGLFTPKIISDILSRSRPEEITTSNTTKPKFDLESFHEGVHAFCGGAMKLFATAAFDPLFYLLHTFIDLIWSLFRDNLKKHGVDPETFPVIKNSSHLHSSDSPTYFGNLTHADGYSEILANSVTYWKSPVCNETKPDCDSRFLICEKESGRCLPTISNDTITANMSMGEPDYFDDMGWTTRLVDFDDD